MFITAVGTGQVSVFKLTYTHKMYQLQHVYMFCQTIAILCDRNALEIRRYGAPTKFPKTARMMLIQAVCGRGVFDCTFCVMYSKVV